MMAWHYESLDPARVRRKSRNTKSPMPKIMGNTQAKFVRAVIRGFMIAVSIVWDRIQSSSSRFFIRCQDGIHKHYLLIDHQDIFDQ